MLYQDRGMRDSSSTNFVWRGSDGAMEPLLPAGRTPDARARGNGSLARAATRAQPVTRRVTAARGIDGCRLMLPVATTVTGLLPAVATVVVVRRFVGLALVVVLVDAGLAVGRDEALVVRRRHGDLPSVTGVGVVGVGVGFGGGGLPGPSFEPGAATAGSGSGPPARTGPLDGAADGWTDGSIVGDGDGATEGDGSADGVTTTGDGWPAGSLEGPGDPAACRWPPARLASRPGRKTTPRQA